MILAEDDRISVADLPPQITPPEPAISAPGGSPAAALPRDGQPLRDQVRFFEHALIRQAIDACGGDRRSAALRLGIGLSSLYRKIEEFETAQAKPVAAPAPGS